MRISSGFKSFHDSSIGSDHSTSTNPGALPRAEVQRGATQAAAQTADCHPTGDSSIHRTEAELHVLHSNLRLMERFMREHPAQASSIRPQYESQRQLYNNLHAAYRQRTGHDFNPNCAGGTMDTRVRPWTAPTQARSSRDYVI